MNPALFIIISCLVITVLIRIVLDIHHIVMSTRQRSHVEQYVAATYTPRISIVIELAQRAETAMPLLDHLRQLQPENIEIIILIKQTAGKHAQTKLAYYRRKHRLTQLKLVRHRKGLTLEKLLATRVSGQFVLRLLPDDRISSAFIAEIRRAFLDKNLTALRPHRQHLPDKRLTSGIEAAIDIWYRSIQQLFPAAPHQMLEPGVVYRHGAVEQTIASSHLTITTTTTPSSLWAIMRRFANVRRAHRMQLLATASFAGLIVSIAGATLFLNNNHIAIVGLVSFAVLFIQNLTNLRGLSLVERLSLVLISPLILIIEPIIVAMSLIQPKRQRRRPRPLSTPC